MLLNIQLWGQLKNLSNKEFVSVDANTVEDAVLKVADEYKELSHLLLSEDKPSKSILVFINQNQYVWGSEYQLSESDSVTFMSPIAGG